MPSQRLSTALLAAALLFAAVPAFAQAVVDAFTVRGVEVDSSASNANAAKDQALADGQRQAFGQLLERLTAAADRARLPKADALAYVRDYTIDQERSSSTRYLATLTVRFNPSAVKKLLREAGISFTDARTRPVVVIPLLRMADRSLLWDDPNAGPTNPWRAAWAGLDGGGLVPLAVPAGDAVDQQTLTAEQAAAGDVVRLAAEGARWHTSDVLTVAGTLSADGRRLEVTLSGLPGTPRPFDSVAYDLKAGETADQLMSRAARDIARAVDTGYKQANALNFDQSTTLSAIVPLAGLDDWLAVRDRLSRVPQVRSFEVVSLSRAEAALVLHVVGDQDKMRTALANAGLSLDWGDGYWTMRTAARR